MGGEVGVRKRDGENRDGDFKLVGVYMLGEGQYPGRFVRTARVDAIVTNKDRGEPTEVG